MKRFNASMIPAVLTTLFQTLNEIIVKVSILY